MLDDTEGYDENDYVGMTGYWMRVASGGGSITESVSNQTAQTVSNTDTSTTQSSLGVDIKYQTTVP